MRATSSRATTQAGSTSTAGSTGNVIQGNYIGIAADRRDPAAQQRSTGIRLAAGIDARRRADRATRRTSYPGTCTDGIFVDGSSSNVIRGNLHRHERRRHRRSRQQPGRDLAQQCLEQHDRRCRRRARNVMSGNLWSGVARRWQRSGNVILGNRIGTDITGTGALETPRGHPARVGIQPDRRNGAGCAERDFRQPHRRIAIFGVSDNLIQGNYIGIDRTGSPAIGNVEVRDLAQRQLPATPSAARPPPSATSSPATAGPASR